MLPVWRKVILRHPPLSRRFTVSSSVQKAVDTAEFPCDAIRYVPLSTRNTATTNGWFLQELFHHCPHRYFSFSSVHPCTLTHSRPWQIYLGRSVSYLRVMGVLTLPLLSLLEVQSCATPPCHSTNILLAYRHHSKESLWLQPAGPRQTQSRARARNYR